MRCALADRLSALVAAEPDAQACRRLLRDEHRTALAAFATRIEAADKLEEEVERVAEWERLVSDASKLGRSSFFHASVGSVLHGQNSIAQVIEWSFTSRGGRQLDLTRLEPVEACSSIYGLCE